MGEKPFQRRVTMECGQDARRLLAASASCHIASDPRHGASAPRQGKDDGYRQRKPFVSKIADLAKGAPRRAKSWLMRKVGWTH